MVAVSPQQSDRPPKILYIDTDADARAAARTVLTEAGYRIVEAEDGLSGVEAAVREHPQLILFALHLQDIDGRVLAAVLKTFPKLSTTPLVAVTESPSCPDATTEVVEWDAHVWKPIDTDRFSHQVAELLAAERRHVRPRDEFVALRELNQRLVCRLLKQLQDLKSLNDLVSHRYRQLDAIHEALQDLTAELSPTEVLDRLLPRLAEALGVEQLSVQSSEAPGARTALNRECSIAGSTASIAEAPGEVERKIPLMVRQRSLGFVIARYSARADAIGQDEHLLHIVASHVAIILENARLYESQRAARAEREAARGRAAFLAEASRILGSSLDYETTLAEVAALALPRLGDFCTIDVVERGVLRRISAAAADHRDGPLAASLRRHTPDLGSSHPVALAVRSAQGHVLRDLPDTLLTEIATSPEHLAVLRAIAPKSVMVVPLRARGQSVGAFCFIVTRSAHPYGGAELALAEDLATRAALAFDNARLYREAQENDRRKDEFLAVLAHELRAPLAPILSAMEIVRRYERDDAVRHAREIVERQVRRQASLVDDLLDLSRISHDKLELRKRVTDLGMVVREALEVVHPLTDARRHRVSVSLPQEALLVSADAGRLGQVVTNLVTNAVKYTPAGGGITITGSREAQWAILRVADTGVGIAPETLPHVFELFVQGGESRRRTESGGLGIGLALVRRLVELHGGTVEARSEGLGRGAEFVVRLPLVFAEDVRRGEERRASRSASVLAHRRILVIEDDVDARETLHLLLELEGHQVSVAAGGREGVALATENRPEVVLIDIGLPDINGYEVARQLRATLGDHVLLVALTGYGRAEDQRRAREAGCDVHLLKPVSPDDLARVLEDADKSDVA